MKFNIPSNQCLFTIDIQNYITFDATFVSKEDTFSLGSSLDLFFQWWKQNTKNQKLLNHVI